jgi:hypothetical protein
MTTPNPPIPPTPADTGTPLPGPPPPRDPGSRYLGPAPVQSCGAELRVNPDQLQVVADQYTALQARTTVIGPVATDEVQRIIATHGVMGYPVAVGVVSALAHAHAAVAAKAADFGTYSRRFTEHAATYRAQDLAGAAHFRGIDTGSAADATGGAARAV